MKSGAFIHGLREVIYVKFKQALLLAVLGSGIAASFFVLGGISKSAQLEKRESIKDQNPNVVCHNRLERGFGIDSLER